MASRIRIALGVVSFILRFTIIDALSIRKPAVTVARALPGTWISEGCYVDVGRTLTGSSYTDNAGMTDESCITYCSNLGYLFAGTEYSSQCFCGNTIAAGATSVPATDCAMPCTGNASETCGGPNRLNLFWSGKAGPVTNPGASGWMFAGCYAEGTTGRTLTHGIATTGGSAAMSVALCTGACQTAGYPLAGVEYSGECYCDFAISNGGTLAPDGLAGCDMLCNGNVSEFCGGASRIDIYDFQNKVALPPAQALTSSTSFEVSSSVISSLSSSLALKSSTLGAPVSQVSGVSIVGRSTSVQLSTSTKSSSMPASSVKSSSVPTSTSKSTSSSSSIKSSGSSSIESSSSSSIIKSTSTTSVTSSKATSASSTVKATSSSLRTSSVATSIKSSTGLSSTLKSSSLSSFTSLVGISKSSSSRTSSSVVTSQTSTSVGVTGSSSKTSSLVPSSSTIATSAPPSSPSKSSVISSSLVNTSTVSSTSKSTSILTSQSGSSLAPSSLLSSSSSQPSSSATSQTSSSTAGFVSASSNLVSTSSTLSSQSTLVSSISRPSGQIFAFSITTSSTSNLLSSSTLAPFSSVNTVVSSSAPGSRIAAPSSTVSSVLASSSAAGSSSIVFLSSTQTSSSAIAIPTLSHKPKIGAWTFQGCYTEAVGMRALSSAAFYDYEAMTLEECANDCSAHTFFGVEYGGECYCGNAINAGSVPAPLGDCNFICTGNAAEYCGAGNRLELYAMVVPTNSSQLPSSTLSSSTQSVTATGSKSTTNSISTASRFVTTLTASILISSAPATTSTASSWTYQGCYYDGMPGRDLSFQQPDNAALTQESCMATCTALGYTIAGLEWSVQCFCDNFLYNGATLATNQADCNVPCGGNSAEMCGAGNRLSVFSIGTPKVFLPPHIQTVGIPANWTYMGCLQDNLPSTQDPTEIVQTFPYMAWQNGNNTPASCIAQCQAFGYNAAGLEYSSQCFCGDVANIFIASDPGINTDPNAVQNYYRANPPQIVADSMCNSPCSGDGQFLCGSGNLMTYYAWNATTPLVSWDIPTGPAAGEYAFLIGGVIVPLMVSQGVNGKVQFIEKYGSGEPNGTGAYELDLTEIGNFTAAWRAMYGLETDVFCSAGLTLPDKAGRQITVGGWAGESNFGIRMYTPDGSAGVQGVNEWQEDPYVLSLQVPRWYCSAMILANGSMLIVGGEIGSNAAQQPTLEILPPTGVPDTTTVSGYSNTTQYLDFLDRTAPFNLYPFVAVVPSGIFIAYYNEARILDENTFQTIKTLPNMPAAVNDNTGGRTYQLEGSMVLLPQIAPYDKNLGVLICGGSTIGGGYALDNCISTVPEDPNPTWTIERMPSRRVMPCMAGLPDGTYLILNGGQHGVAGFGLGGDPNLNAVLYDPTKPVNARMSVMANTTVARLYHSEATVLLDGRVLVTGSDPTGNFLPTPGSWPEEYRVEVFSPPYLLNNLPRPTFVLTGTNSTDWDYGQSVTFTLTSGSTSALKVSMLGSVVSTHGNAMGQRTIFPAVSCAGTTCTITAPPNAHICPPGWFMLFVVDGPTPSVGQFIRIGKDPANMGNWPEGVSKFTTPGV